MNLGVVFILVVAVVLVILLILPRVRGIARGERTTVERRSGAERRRRRIRVPIERRRRARRAQDAARAFVDSLPK